MKDEGCIGIPAADFNGTGSFISNLFAYFAFFVVILFDVCE
jgi:hypothetical protein